MRNALCPSVVASLSEVTKVRAVISHLHDSRSQERAVEEDGGSAFQHGRG